MQTSSGFWLDAQLDLRSVTEAFKLNWNLPAGLPNLSVQLASDGNYILTHGVLEFDEPLNLALEPWNFPTNLLRYPLASFTAARGVSTLLGNFPLWGELQVGLPPNQLFL